MMKQKSKKSLRVTALCVVAALLLCLCGCGQAGTDEVSDNRNAEKTADCYNGNFVGSYEADTKVLSFKGIPYAKAPEGELRWKAPQSVEASDETIFANRFGNSPIQYTWFSEPIKTNMSEDCLTLNVWTNNLEDTDKAVMVYFHGGSYAWGGTSEPIYNGQYIVKEHPDVVVVTVNYRIGLMGFIDFSEVPGGEDYPDAPELGLLDCVEALRWVKQNIGAFGGDADNVTIFGESSGAGITSGLLASDYAGDLFHRVIAQSGSLRLTYTDKQFDASSLTEALLYVTDAETMDDLMALSTAELIAYNKYEIDESGTTLNDLYNMPLRGGSVTKADGYKAIAAAAEKGVDLLIGTTADEQNYWISEMAEKDLNDCTKKELNTALQYFDEYYLQSMFETAAKTYNDEQLGKMAQYMDSLGVEKWQAKSRLFTETVYHQPAIRMAEKHSASGDGKTYMYYFKKANDSADCLGACHSIDLPYVFHNLKADGYGTIDEGLANDVCTAWTNFAKTGDPSSDTIKWEEYDSKNRKTMVIGNDNTFEIVSDPESQARKWLSFVVDYAATANGS